MPLINLKCVFCAADTNTQDTFQLYNVRVCNQCAPGFVDFLVEQYRSNGTQELSLRDAPVRRDKLKEICQEKRRISTSYILDPETKTIYTSAGGLISCGIRMYVILEYLVNHTGQICSRGELHAALAGTQAHIDSTYVPIGIARIRQRLGGGVIQTCGSNGYKLLEGFIQMVESR